MNEDQQALPDVNDLAGIIPVDDLDTFVRTMTAWHESRMAQIKHLLTVPPGSSFEVGEQTITLSGTALEAFKLAVELCIMQIGTLPFVAEMEDVEPAADAKG